MPDSPARSIANRVLPIPSPAAIPTIRFDGNHPPTPKGYRFQLQDVRTSSEPAGRLGHGPRINRLGIGQSLDNVFPVRVSLQVTIDDFLSPFQGRCAQRVEKRLALSRQVGQVTVERLMR